MIPIRLPHLIFSVMLLLGSCVPQYDDAGISVIELSPDEDEQRAAWR